MYGHTYTKFYALVVLALVLGFIGMEVVSTDVDLGSGISGFVAYEAEDGLIESSDIAGNWAFLFIGVAAGAVLMATITHIYHSEKRNAQIKLPRGRNKY